MTKIPLKSMQLYLYKLILYKILVRKYLKIITQLKVVYIQFYQIITQIFLTILAYTYTSKLKQKQKMYMVFMKFFQNRFKCLNKKSFLLNKNH